MLCEKPISNDIAQAEAMVAKAREKRRCFGIDLNHRFTPAAILAKKWVDEGRLGHLLFMNMSMWIKNPTESSPYFQLKALHPHTVDIMRYFCGDIVAVQCFATKAPGRTIWSTATFNMKFANGVVGTLTGSYDIERGHPMEYCTVAGTFRNRLHRFLEQVTAGVAPEDIDGSGASGLAAQKVLAAAIESLDTGTVVQVR